MELPVVSDKPFYDESLPPRFRDDRIVAKNYRRVLNGIESKKKWENLEIDIEGLLSLMNANILSKHENNFGREHLIRGLKEPHSWFDLHPKIKEEVIPVYLKEMEKFKDDPMKLRQMLYEFGDVMEDYYIENGFLTELKTTPMKVLKSLNPFKSALFRGKL